MNTTDCRIFDCNCMLGVGPENVGTSFDTPEILKENMHRYNIDTALVYGALAKHYNPIEGNRLLSKQIAQYDHLFANWIVLPGYTGEFPVGDSLIAEMATNSVVSARLCPKKFGLQLSSWACDDILATLQSIRMPLFLDFDISHWSDVLPWDSIKQIAQSYPDLPIILTRLGCGYNRILFPLLDQCRNIMFELSYFDANNGIETICKKFGADRMLLGTDAPLHEPSCPIGMLALAEISPTEKMMIASGNMENLIGGLQYA